MNLNETKKIVDFMKENGISELEYAAKGTTIKLKLKTKELKKGKKNNEETFAPILDEIEEQVEEVGVREVTAYTAEPDPTEELAEELETEVEKPSAAVRAIVAVGGARRKAVNAVSGIFKRRTAAAPDVETVEDEEDEVSTELDVMEDHEKAAKAANRSLRSRNPFARFIKSQKDGAAHAKAQLEDEDEEIQNAEEVENVTEEAPAEEAAEKSGRLGGLLNRFRRKKGEDAAAEEPVEEEAAEESVEMALDVTDEEAPEETEPVVKSVEDVAEAVEEPAEEPVVEAVVETEPVVESVEDVAEPVVEEPAEEEDAEPVVESAEDTEEAAEEERSEEDKLFDIVG